MAETEVPARGELGEEVPVEIQVAATVAGDELSDTPVAVLVETGEESRRLSLGEDRQLTLHLAPRRSVRIRAEAPGYWALPVVVIPEARQEAVLLRLVPAGTLEGRLRWPRGSLPPTELTLTLDPPWQEEIGTRPSGHPIPHASEICPVNLEGRFSCLLPAGRMDLRLRASGFASHFLWDVEIPTGKTLKLDDLMLRRGASLVGWVEAWDGGPPGPGIRARLETDAARPGVGRRMGFDRMAQEASVDPRGFFHFEAVPPGSYRLQVTGEGFAVAERRVQILEDLEANLPEPVVLQEPARWVLALSPPLDPFGRPWEVELRTRSTGDPVEPVQIDRPGGRWVFDGLTPGPHQLQVSSTQGGQRTDWWWEEPVVEPGETEFSLEIPLVEVIGRVLLGTEPVEARVFFGERHGVQRIPMIADEEGRFNGFLPEEGEWPVTVGTRETGWRTLKPVEVTVPEGDRYAEVEIVIPTNRLEGRVVDEEGEGVAGARVIGFQADLEIQLGDVTTDDDGHFDIHGVEPGQVLLAARSVEGSSSGVVIDVPEDGETEPVELILRDMITVQGRVVGPGGPVAGAQVYLTGRGLGSSIQERPLLFTDAQGRFTTEVPEGSTGLDVTVMAPGHGARLWHIPSPLPRELVLAVETAVAGTLLLRSPTPPVLRHNGSRAGMAVLGAWAQRHGGGEIEPGLWRLPAMHPGTWLLCDSSGVECVAGTLPAGGELLLSTQPASTEPANTEPANEVPAEGE